MEFTKEELKFLQWFLYLSPDNPIEQPKEKTIFKNSEYYTDNDFVNLYKKIARSL